MKREKIVSTILWIIILGWTGLSTVYWSLYPHISTFTDAGLHTSAFQMLKGTGAIGPDLLILTIGLFLSKKRNTENLILKEWLLTWLVSFAAFIVAAFCCQIDNWGTFTPTIFNSLFPFLRNTYPLIFGPLLGLTINQCILRLNSDWQKGIFCGIWLLITVAFFSAPNMWGWENKTLVLFYALLTVIGAQASHYNKLKTKFWWFAAIGFWLINAVLEFLVPFMSTNSSTVGRFSLASNVLIVASAYSIFKLITPYLVKMNIDENFIFTYLTLIQNTALMMLIATALAKKTNQASAITGIWAIGIVVLFLIIAFLSSYMWKSKLFLKVNNKIDDFCEHTFHEQIVQTKRLLTKSLPNIGIIVISYIVSAISLLVMNLGDGNILSTLNTVFSQHESNIFFAGLFCFVSIKFLQAITKRYWFSSITIIAINAVIVIANKLKMSARNEPILPVDMHFANVAGQIFKMVDIRIWIATLIGLLLITLLIILLEKYKPIKYNGNKSMRIWLIILAPLMFLSSTVWNQTNYPASNFLSFINDKRIFWDQLAAVKYNGPVVQFLNNIDITTMNKPSGYSRVSMEAIKHRYAVDAKSINQNRTNDLDKQSLVFVLSESFSNPTHVPGIQLKNNPIPYITKLKDENTGGLMISSGYGGGTANMEYMALTGFAMCNFSPTLSTPYSQLVTSLKHHPSIVDNFKYAVCIHPYLGTFYNRISVYKNFGVNKFIYLGNKDYPIKHKHHLEKNPYLSDETAYANVLDQLKGHKHGEFINLLTMQNHMPYDKNFYKDKAQFNPVKTPSGTNINSLKNYIAGINYTDLETKAFINKIDNLQKPVTVVFYGDHLPGDIYSNDMSKYGLQKHETDYFIYSNKYAREHGAHNFKKSTSFVSPTDFIAMAAKQTNSKVNWYQALLTELYYNVPVFTRGFKSTPNSTYNTNTQFVSRHGKLLKYSQLTKKQKRIYHDYQLVQYDITAGHHYLVHDMK